MSVDNADRMVHKKVDRWTTGDGVTMRHAVYWDEAPQRH
jgi:hypothetical protein